MADHMRREIIMRRDPAKKMHWHTITRTLVRELLESDTNIMVAIRKHTGSDHPISTIYHAAASAKYAGLKATQGTLDLMLAFVRGSEAPVEQWQEDLASVRLSLEMFALFGDFRHP